MKITERILTLMLLTFSLGLYAQEKDPNLVEPNLPARGGAIPIPDDGYDGTLGSMACLTINETTMGTVDDVDIEVTMEHTWIGDLAIKLVSPDGTIATVLSRPGSDEPADDGTGPVGHGSNLEIGGPITFSTTNGLIDAETMGEPGFAGGDIVVCVDDGECSFIPNPGAATDSGDLSTLFDGETAAGNWQLCVGDSAEDDTGNLDSAVLSIVTGGGGGGEPTISLSTDDTDFGLVNVNDQETTLITLENTGDAALDVTAISDPGEPFSLMLSGPTRGTLIPSCSIPPFSLDPSESCDIEINFAPTAPGDYMSSFDITSNAASSPDTITVRGSVPEPPPEAEVVPTMNWVGLIALMLVLSGVGLVLMRRRQEA